MSASGVQKSDLVIRIHRSIAFQILIKVYLLLNIGNWGPSRWRRSKTWRSPSSQQIHQKYIYMWNNSYRTPTEHWQKISDFPKDKKLPTYLCKAKEKRKNRDKRIGTDLHQWEGAVKEEMFPRTRKSLRGRRLWVAEGGSFRATEESAATGVRRAKRRDSRTEARRRPALTSPRGLSAQPPGRAGLGAEVRALVRSQGEDWGWRREHSLKGLAHHS